MVCCPTAEFSFAVRLGPHSGRELRKRADDGVRHSDLNGGVRSQAIVFVTPDVSMAQTLVRAAAVASCSLEPSTARQARRPSNSMHSSHRMPPTWKLE